MVDNIQTKEDVRLSETKISYLYQYLLNFRSRWNHEMKTTIKRNDKTLSLNEDSMKQFTKMLGEELRLVKEEMEKYGIDTKGRPVTDKIRWTDEDNEENKEEQDKEDKINIISLGKIDKQDEWFEWEEKLKE